MKNSFNIEVSLSECPVYPYEWTRTSLITDIPVSRVSSHVLKSVLLYEGSVRSKTPLLLLSDGKNAAVIKLSKSGQIKARSFLKFADELDVAEMAMNLKERELDIVLTDKMVHYERGLVIDAEMKKYLIDRIKKCRDENLSKYLYYLYFDEIQDYSRERLITEVSKSSIDKNIKLYNFLIET